MIAFLRIALLLTAVSAYKWMEKIKVPSMSNFRQMIDGKRFGDKKLVVITGTSSGLGKQTAKHLLRTGEYHVIGAVRDLEKMATVAEVENFNMENFTPMKLDLGSYSSVHNFCDELDKFRADRPLDRVVCNAAVYQPSLDYAKWTEDDHEQQLQTNYLSHFLMCSKLMPLMKGSEDPRMIMVGSVTGNDNTVGGGGVYPVADLKDLEGLEYGCKNPISMIDGYNFNGAKAYKDTKLCLMMFSNMLHERYHRSTGIAFSSIYPGCIAESPLFREKRPWFRKYFPVFMKYVTGGFVGEEEAGQRLFQVIHDPRCTKSGVYWSWNGGPREGRGAEAIEKGGQIVGAGGAGGGWDSIFENDQSDKVLDRDKAGRLWKLSSEITNAEWPLAYQPKSPCPTLKVVTLATSLLTKWEDMQRMKKSREMGLTPALAAAAAAKAKEEARAAAKEKELKIADALRLPAQNPAKEPEQQRLGDRLREKAAKTGAGSSAPVGTEAVNTVAALNKILKPAERYKKVTRKVTKALKPKAQQPEFDLASLMKSGKVEMPKIPAGHELLGDIPVVFNPEGKATMARAGQPLSEIATQADAFINYKCRKGECGTCEVQINGKWVRACQHKIPPLPKGEVLAVSVRPVAAGVEKKKPSTFFSPASFMEGVVNNGLGMVGFVKECAGADPEFEERMERERRIAEEVEKRRLEKVAAGKAGGVPQQ